MDIVLSSAFNMAHGSLPEVRIQKIPLGLLEVEAYLTTNKLSVKVLDLMYLSKADWLSEVKRLAPKVIVLLAQTDNTEFLRSLMEEVKVFKEENKVELVVVAVNEIESLIETGADFVVHDNYCGSIYNLLSALSSPFNMFYDHLKGIAFKNGAGSISKTPVEDQKVPGNMYEYFDRQLVSNYLKTAYLWYEFDPGLSQDELSVKLDGLYSFCKDDPGKFYLKIFTNEQLSLVSQWLSSGTANVGFYLVVPCAWSGDIPLNELASQYELQIVIDLFGDLGAGSSMKERVTALSTYSGALEKGTENIRSKLLYDLGNGKQQAKELLKNMDMLIKTEVEALIFDVSNSNFLVYKEDFYAHLAAYVRESLALIHNPAKGFFQKRKMKKRVSKLRKFLQS